MPAYYGVQRSQEYLAHYGIKGMKWGVQNAKDTHDKQKLKEHYESAVTKLNDLKNKANIDTMKKERKEGLKGLALGAASLGTSALMDHLDRTGKLGGNVRVGLGLPIVPLGVATKAGMGLGALMTGVGAAEAIGSHYRTTAKGHAKAVKKAAEWEREMKSAFKGTQYAKTNPDEYYKKMRKRREIEGVTY